MEGICRDWWLNSRMLVAVVLTGWFSLAHAGDVELEVRDGLTASAKYSQGEPDLTVLMILHGFLQTADFSTVSRLHASLADAGMTVLSPTLSLGIDRRKQSLSCEAIHTHDLSQDVEEIAQWVDWLQARHSKPVVLIGHSAGGLVVSRYLYEHAAENMAQGILISLSHLQGEVKNEGAGPLGEYRLGFCQTYTSIPAAYRSYVEWDGEKVIQAIKRHDDRVAVILGSGDERIHARWRNMMAENSIRIVNVQGANHFFDNAHEFDLLEAVERLLADVGH